MKILCLWYATDAEISRLKAALPAEAEVVAPQGEYFSRFESTFAELKGHAVDADAMIGWAIPKGLLEIADKLKLLCWLHAGCDDLDIRLLKERRVTVANTRGANAIAVAEQAIMFVLALAKQALFKHHAAQEGRRLFPVYADEYRSAMLYGRTLAVVGIGNIGGHIAKCAKGFGMHVLGVRRNKDRPAAGVDMMYGMDELRDVLAKSDYVVLATPNTPDTFQSFGKAELNVMKPSAFLINIARGNLIQEKPLYEALTSGRLRGYAADVWWRYEFGRAFPIGYMPRLEVHKLPNVISSIDQASNADDVLDRHLQWGIQSLVEFSKGAVPTRAIDLDLGY
ncbi:NAD(P)-dependent oxidoreductase [Bradyrhizobium sp. 521_C7_N1_3]|uniref:NAD(P)-dependent oxidoreductase n=1 Tax=Bradyrhizobium sp. 521_C7_N1_3 TaxID=3240368 RepID=UPI003F8A8765